MSTRYVASSLGGGWWAVFDRKTGREVTDRQAFADSHSDSMGSRAEARTLCCKLNQSL